MDKQYRHSDFINCKDIADFAKIYAFKDSKGKIIGRNKIFKILRTLGILDKQNIPYQNHINHFRMLEKEYHSAIKTHKKTIVFIKQESLRYFADKVSDYLEKQNEKDFVAEAKRFVAENPPIAAQVEEESCGSPLDYPKEKALDWLNRLPPFMSNVSMAVKVREKWGVGI